MTTRWFLITAITVGLFSIPPSSVEAQNGQLIEGLFRTLAETQLERERQKRLEAEQRAKQEAQARAAGTARDPYQVKLPSGFGVPQPTPPRNQPSRVPGNRVPGNAPDSFLPPMESISVRSPEAAEYANELVRFNQTIDPLIHELRGAASRNSAIRALMPETYEIAASGRTLLRRCDGISSLTTIESSHRDLDRRWRQLSFRLQAVNGLSNSCTSAIRTCDDLCASMGRRLNLRPQFDRSALRDQMMVGATYMQTLMDDLHLSSLSQDRCHTLEHDCRLLRQRLISAAEHVDHFSYDDCVNRFNDFAGDWRNFAAKLYVLNDPYMNRRLDRISEVGNNVYELLRLTPPTSSRDVAPIAQRLQTSLGLVTQRITLNSLASLPPADQIKVLEHVRTLTETSNQLVANSREANPAMKSLQTQFLRFDATWNDARPLFARVRSISRGQISDVEQSCQQLREMLDARGEYSPPVRLAHLVHSAAALEGSAEYMQRTIIRHQSDLRPNSFRDQVVGDAKSLYRHAREVHELLSRSDRLNDQRHLAKLQEETEHLLEDWNEFSKRLGQLRSHGMDAGHAEELRRIQQDIVPYVAQLSAALLAR